MDITQLKNAIRRELPHLLRDDPSLRDYVLEVARKEFVGRSEYEDRFYEILGELRRDREEQNAKWAKQEAKQDAKWAEQSAKWAKQDAKWDKQDAKWDKQDAKWEEQKEEAKRLAAERKEEAKRLAAEQKEEAKRLAAEQQAKWDKQETRWLEQEAKWQANQTQMSEQFQRVHEEIMAQAKKFDRGIGALGARWGIQSEKTFRNALAGILEEHFGVTVLNVNEYDETGEVFGQPDQIELDIIIKNGLLLICELKSSIDKAGMYIFERKVRFYEKRHQRKADRLIVISPMIDARALPVAERLGIQTYSDASDLADETVSS